MRWAADVKNIGACSKIGENAAATSNLRGQLCSMAGADYAPRTGSIGAAGGFFLGQRREQLALAGRSTQ